MATDYKSYLFIYECKEYYGLFFSENIWVYTREKIAGYTMGEILDVIFPTYLLKKTIQGVGCEYKNDN